MQRERVQEAYPWTWEVPFAVGCVVASVFVVACQVARAIANFTAGAGWWWPSLDRLITSVGGILGGDAAAGLPAGITAADPASLRVWLLIVLLLTGAGCGWCVVTGWRRWGPDRMRGVASAAEAHELLGVARLRRVAPIVRPDLHPAATDRAVAGGRP